MVALVLLFCCNTGIIIPRVRVNMNALISADLSIKLHTCFSDTTSDQREKTWYASRFDQLQRGATETKGVD